MELRATTALRGLVTLSPATQQAKRIASCLHSKISAVLRCSLPSTPTEATVEGGCHKERPVPHDVTLLGISLIHEAGQQRSPSNIKDKVLKSTAAHATSTFTVLALSSTQCCGSAAARSRDRASTFSTPTGCLCPEVLDRYRFSMLTKEEHAATLIKTLLHRCKPCIRNAMWRGRT